MKRLGLDERAVLRLIPNSDTKRINRVDIMRITKFSERRVKKIIDVLVNDFDIVILGKEMVEQVILFRLLMKQEKTE